MNNLMEKLRRIGIRADQQAIEALLSHCQKSKKSHAEMLEQLVEIELREREARNMQRRVSAAALGKFKPIDAFDWNHPRAIDRALYEHLYETLDFIKQAHNVLLRGQAGVGKTVLAKNLGARALQKGHTVLFCTLPEALADLLKQESLPAFERRLRRYTQPDLLILDELGYIPSDARAADILYHIISRRHEVRGVVITTNLAYKSWNKVFPEATCLSALVDRFAQHCHTIDIDGDSWRDKDRKQREDEQKNKRQSTG
jgi:DNA replication protein DnaC